MCPRSPTRRGMPHDRLHPPSTAVGLFHAGVCDLVVIVDTARAERCRRAAGLGLPDAISRTVGPGADDDHRHGRNGRAPRPSRDVAIVPTHRRARGPLKGTLALAALWAAWHAPMFTIVEVYRHMTVGTILGGFVLGLTCGAIVLARVAHATSGRVLAVAL